MKRYIVHGFNCRNVALSRRCLPLLARATYATTTSVSSASNLGIKRGWALNSHSPRFLSVLPKRSGLFDNPALSAPEGFDAVTEKALLEATVLVKNIIENAENPSVEIVRKFDELSDVLCQVADLAECIRLVHPDAKMKEKALHACVALTTYVEELNTSTSLHRALKNFIESGEFSEADEVTRRTAESFMHDFEISGIHLEASAREEVVKLNKQILEVSHQFLQNTNQPAVIDKEQCPPFLVEKFPSDSKHIVLTHVPYYNPDSKLRALSYLIFYGVFPKQQETLEALLNLRHKLASLVGYPTYAHRVLKSLMAQDSATVSEFLEALSRKILPLAREEAEEMRTLKLEVGDQVNPQVLQPWDVIFATSLAEKKYLQRGMDGIRNWFSLDSCLVGLGNLFDSLFGVKLEPVSVKEGETWDSSVRKYAFVHEKEGLLGYTYFDFYDRQDKMAADCHFTIKGGRELGDSSYQLPIITLCCNFQQPGAGRPTLLSQRSVENLFHEMGHALHSMLGRPKYQNVTGTRCSTDFAEVPSILMEFFVADRRVLSTFARHHKTNEPLPESLMDIFRLSSNGFFPAFDTQMQVLYAVMDQRFHGRHPLGESTVELFTGLHRDYAPIDYIPQTAWFLRFGHLYGYAAKYYSYLWARAVASLIWKSCFESDPFSREVGERYREMLMYGGGIHPCKLVRNVLGFEPTAADLVEALYSNVVEHREQIGKLTKQNSVASSNSRVL